MPQNEEFPGFSRELLDFYSGLKENNKKEWFDAHRDDYEKCVMEPARLFVIAMGERLRGVVPEIIADPRVNYSIFRINRDTRFSHDKTPYKTHLAVWFWEGQGKRMERPGFYFHAEPKKLFIAGGLYRFEQPFLDAYRRAVSDSFHGEAIAGIIGAFDEEIKKDTSYTIYPGEPLKKVPAGFDSNHERVDLLRYRGLSFCWENEIPEEFYSRKIIEFALKRFQKMVPLHLWFLEVMKRAE